MVWLFFLAIVVLIATVILIILLENRLKVCLIGIVAVAVLLIGSCIAFVPTGFTGILTTFGKVEERIVPAGINFIAPWQNVVTMDNRTQKAEFKTSAFSSDIQQVDIEASVNYCIDQETARELYRTVGTNYYQTLIYPRLLENTKSTFSTLTAENLVANRDNLSRQVVGTTAKDLSEYGIIIVTVSIENIDFTDAFTDAVEAKQVAAQNKLTAEIEQSQETMKTQQQAERDIIKAETAANKTIIAAKADLEAKKLKADASLYAKQKEAEGNEAFAKTLSPAVNTYYWIKEWDGKLPTMMLGESTGLMYNLDSLEGLTEPEATEVSE